MNRREFISWVGVGGIASSLPIAIAACSPKIENTASQSAVPPSPSDGFQVVGTVADLDKNGQILNKQSSDAPVLVVRNLADSKTVMAVNATCTHQGCTLDWKADQKVFLCPCHKAKFAPDGKVLQGPAQKPLPTYEVKLEGDSILVKKS